MSLTTGPISGLMERRQFLSACGIAGLPFVLPSIAFSSEGQQVRNQTFHVKDIGRTYPLIVINLDGGASHIDTLDPHPEAPVQIRSPYGAIQTTVPGVLVSELMPQLSQEMDRIALWKNVYHRNGVHNQGSAIVHTGYDEVNSRSVEHSALPINDSPMVHLSRERFQREGIGYLMLNSVHTVLPGAIQSNEATVVTCDLSGNYKSPFEHKRLVLKERHEGRLDLLRSFDNRFTSPQVEKWKTLAGVAENVLDGDYGEAFDLSQVSDKERERYGRNELGNAVIIAKRLVQSGVQFILINDGDWDMHGQNNDHYLSNLDIRQQEVRLSEVDENGIQKKIILTGEGYARRLDRVLAALIKDFSDQAAIVVTTEFGRTPKLWYGWNNDRPPGRDHWPHQSFYMAFGGNVKPGIFGSSDNSGTINGNDSAFHATLLAEATLNATGRARVHSFSNERFDTLPQFK